MDDGDPGRTLSVLSRIHMCQFGDQSTAVG